MPYLFVEDFRNGLDVRKSAATAPAGTLQTLDNAHITRGGEIQKRKAFVSTYTLPSGATKGMAQVNDALYVFGDGPTPSGMPSDVGYVRLQHPTDSTLTLNDVLDWQIYAGKLYVVAEFSDFSVHHFYDGTAVTSYTYALDRPTAVRTFDQKMYGVRDTSILFSELNDPTDWGSGFTGSGVIDMSEEISNAFNLKALAVYQQRLAVFAKRATAIWQMDPDPASNVLIQLLDNIGCFAPRSALSYGDEDVFFLSDTGLRSLRARDSSNNASVTDVGTPVDKLLLEDIATLGDAQASLARSIIEPKDGRFWLAIGSKIYVLSFFRTSKVSAWSTYSPGFTPDELVVVGNRVYVRADDTIYLFGGANDDTYDSSTVTVEMPYLDAGMPAHRKHWQAMDMAGSGTWLLQAGVDPNRPDQRETMGRLTGTTYNNPSHQLRQWGTHIGLKLTHSAEEAATLGNLAIHYETNDAD